ncbi:MAG: endonuclease/exonuclease/phosphatase family protein [Chthoniobacterales bacterium]|nr:endonuclease/exonuclease/phosphatase family protein [Chthoniobacterales bacterium]
MKRTSVAAALLIFAAALTSAEELKQGSGSPNERADSIRAAFWNIRWFPGGRPNASKREEDRQIRSVHSEITKLNADVIGFEEVRDWESAAVAVKPMSGFKVDVCSNFPPREGQTETQQVAIASDLQPISAWAESWQSGRAITPPRGFAFAAYEIAPRQLLLVYAVHLKSNRGELVEDIAIREESIRQLRSHIAAMQQAYGKLGKLAWLIGGDFNTAPDDPRFKNEQSTSSLTGNGFSWVWKNVPMQQRVTMPPDARFPAACFDHIFFRGLRLKKAEVVATSGKSSDHRAIRAEFALEAQVSR